MSGRPRHRFDLAGPLPDGTTLLEASAGTGKTWTVGALVARYVAEGEADLDEMLVITFSRAASQELRERVRERAGRGRAGPRATRRRRPRRRDSSRRLLAARRERRRGGRARLRDALAAFDGATIATTHSSASSCCARWASPATPTPGPSWSRTSTTWSPRSSTTSTSRAFAATDAARRRSTGRRGLALARDAVEDPQAGWCTADATTSPPAAPSGVRPRGPRPRSTGANGGWASSATTTCSAGSPTRLEARRRARPHRMRPGGGSCWSTSSRTPTPCSGRSSTRAFARPSHAWS